MIQLSAKACIRSWRVRLFVYTRRRRVAYNLGVYTFFSGLVFMRLASLDESVLCSSLRRWFPGHIVRVLHHPETMVTRNGTLLGYTLLTRYGNFVLTCANITTGRMEEAFNEKARLRRRVTVQ